ncbi:protein involved in processing of HyaA and HyaB proteins [Paraburkholderia ribeironis]|uniref:Protein involved in processing of HyaA and HyaB proteins n=1 Tax=Paraburkholderia ribeironis TaxID=1247936 RepID=A0A1N7RT04_9BURK|nr:HyaD/HybD family hydrogenase maturation endopeptidase [Paraburkholderia ribeironis]SIT38235.1 protein involved in processing of HyaA and HyaB proteins [Paraburkholderia ribeironis]
MDALHNAPGATPYIVVLGLGNLLWADEGFGVRCVERLQQHYACPPNIQLVDGGTQGLYLIRYVQAARRLLIFDAIDYGLEPGTLKVVKDDDVPSFVATKKMSLHQTGFQEVLQLAKLTEQFPERLVVIGCQPEELEDYGGSLRPVVKAAIEPALALACDVLHEWGAEPMRRAESVSNEDAVVVPLLDMSRYEGERPSLGQACRIGDARILLLAGAQSACQS